MPIGFVERSENRLPQGFQGGQSLPTHVSLSHLIEISPPDT